jgi:hypothetical protein
MDEKQQPRPHHFPLRVLVIGWHEHNPGYGTMGLMRHFRNHGSVVAFGTVERLELAKALIRDNLVNTIFLDLRIGRYYGSPEGYDGPDQVGPSIAFINEVRSDFPQIVFVLFTDPMMRSAICRVNRRFEHYFYLENGYSKRASLNGTEIDAMLARCEEWHRNLFDYDVAMSFAHEDRSHARELADLLHGAGARVFFDEYENATLFGTDLFVTLYDIYRKRCGTGTDLERAGGGLHIASADRRHSVARVAKYNRLYPGR